MPDAAAEVNVAGDSVQTAGAAATCRNCGAYIGGHYCANCGQETALALPTFRSFMREAAGRYVALDGRLWRTLFALIAKPGFLTLEYFAGRRRRYIRPARLFLVLYLLLFAVIGFVQSPADLGDEIVFVQSDAEEAGLGSRGPREPDATGKASRGARRAASSDANRTVDPSSKGVDTPKASGEANDAIDAEDDTLIGLDKDLNLTLRMSGTDLTVPAPLRKRYEQFKRLSKEEKGERLYAGALRYGPYAVVVLLPAFALLLKLAYLGRGTRYPTRPRRYAEHLVYGAHLHAFAAVMIILMLLPVPWLNVAGALWIVYYAMRARQVVYGGRWWAGLIRAFFVATIYTVLVAFAIMGLLAAAIMLR